MSSDYRAQPSRTAPAADPEVTPDAPVAPDATRGTPAATPHPGRGAAPESLLEPNAATVLADRWEDIQSGFLDSPQQAVEAADSLVQDVMGQLSERMAEQRGRLDEQWHGGREVSTEDLRRTLQQYRSFFQRLLAA